MNRIDPSGIGYIWDPGGGGSSGIGAGYGVGDGAGGDATAGGNVRDSWQCQLQRIMFLVGLVLLVVGATFDYAHMLRWAGAIAGLSMAVNVNNILQNGLENSILDLIDFGITLLTAIILPALDLWGRIWLGTQFAARFSNIVGPIAIAASIGIVAMDFYILQTGPCGF